MSTELARIVATLAGTSQRTRLLVNGVAGPLTERQRALALDILRDLEILADAAGAAVAAIEVDSKVFALGPLVNDVVGAYRFIAHRKQLALTLIGGRNESECNADPNILRAVLNEAIGHATNACPTGGKVSVEVCRSSDRMAVDISAPGWDPRLPPAPAAGSGLAVSVLRTASGARLVVSMPAAF